MRVLTEEQQKWCDTIGEFCKKKEIEPIMLEWDKIVDPSKAIPMDVYAKAFKLGLNSFRRPPRSTAATRWTWPPPRSCTKRWVTTTATLPLSCRPPTWP